jgi:cytochrome P450 family 4
MPWLGTGLLTSTGKKWSQRRKIITPTFHFKILEEFIETFDRQSDILVDKLREKMERSNEKTFDIYPFITLCALDVICESAMGTTVDAQQGNSDYAKAVNE